MFDLSDEVRVWATAASDADRRFEGGDGHPGHSGSEYVLPYADREHLGVLLTSLEPRLTAVAHRHTRDPEAARDIVQSAFEKAIRHAARFEGRSSVSTWLYRIVSNEALMWLRSERRRARWLGTQTRSAPERLVDPAPDPAERALTRQESRRLAAGLARLSDAERQVITECALAGASYADYAQRTGNHPAAVKSRAHRARLRLRADLQDDR